MRMKDERGMKECGQMDENENENDDCRMTRRGHDQTSVSAGPSVSVSGAIRLSVSVAVFFLSPTIPDHRCGSSMTRQLAHSAGS